MFVRLIYLVMHWLDSAKINKYRMLTDCIIAPGTAPIPRMPPLHIGKVCALACLSCGTAVVGVASLQAACLFLQICFQFNNPAIPPDIRVLTAPLFGYLRWKMCAKNITQKEINGLSQLIESFNVRDPGGAAILGLFGCLLAKKAHPNEKHVPRRLAAVYSIIAVGWI